MAVLSRRGLHRAAAPLLALILAALGVSCALLAWPHPLMSETEKPIFLWCDATANLERLGSRERLAAVLDRAVAAGITGVVIDVKPISGAVLYDSDFAPRLTRWPGHGQDAAMQTVDPAFDRLSEACRLGHERGLSVFASVNVFAEGHKQVTGLTDPERGAVYSTHPDWAAWDYMALPGETEGHLRPTTEHATSYTAFVSPFNPEVRAHELNIIREVAERHPIDGIVLDRVRFDGLQSDFSPWAREAFERHLRQRVANWPEDICRRGAPTEAEPLGALERGPLFDEWQRFRAQTIHDFIVEAREHVKDVNPPCLFTVYVGAWYPLYTEVGVNWGSPRFYPRWPGFPEGWPSTGYAHLLDMLFAGTYFFAVTPEEAAQAERADGRTDPWLSVAGSAQVAMDAVMGACPVIGSVYVEQYLFESPTGEFDRTQFARALRAAHATTDGLMIFDLVHLEQQRCWDVVEEFGREVHPRPTTAAPAPSDG